MSLSPAPNPTPASRAKPTDETVKETFQAIVSAFVLAFVFRAYVVEAFVIPTGSMAPTLLGEHVRVVCDQCGYTFTLGTGPHDRRDSRSGNVQPVLMRDIEAVCPMCHFPNPLPRGTRPGAGDRILVHKYIYSIVEPRRWDVVVFKNPETPAVNFIKRLVGLPQESLWVIEGNIYVKPAYTGDEAWHIARKSERLQAQRAVWQPIYHSQYIPLDQGHDTALRAGRSWALPWVSQSGSEGGPAGGDGWENLEARRDYRHLGSNRGVLRFDFERAADGWLFGREGQPVWYAYNRVQAGSLSAEPLEDVRLAAKVQPHGPGVSLTLRTTARLDHDTPDASPQPLWATLGPQGRCALETLDADSGQVRVLQERTQAPWPPGQATDVELWFVDQEASLWINGQRVLQWSFELSLDTLVARKAAPLFPQIEIEATGDLTLHQVELDRDIYYSSDQDRPPSHQGTLSKIDNTREGKPINLLADEFFCMGDNSPLSQDSRFWPQPNPWIRRRMLAPTSAVNGVVPRKLMMGRAFFVYFPAPFAWDASSPALIPNFGDMRFIH